MRKLKYIIFSADKVFFSTQILKKKFFLVVYQLFADKNTY